MCSARADSRLNQKTLKIRFYLGYKVESYRFRCHRKSDSSGGKYLCLRWNVIYKAGDDGTRSCDCIKQLD